MSSLVFVQLLCGPGRQLHGLHWTCAQPQPDVLRPWLADPALQALTASLPCFATWDGAGEGTADDQAALAASGLRLQAPPCAQRAMGDAWPANAPCVAGDWYTMPPAKPNVAQAASRQRALELLQLVSTDAETRDIEAVFRRDAAMSYQLLRLVNSAAMGSRREITSFAQAIVMLGRSQLQRWLNLLVFAARDDDERSAMLLAHAGLRARCMELWAQALGQDKADQEQAFMAGMFSMLGVLFGAPLSEMLVTIRVSDALRSALLDGQGPLGDLLQLCLRMEGRDAVGTQAWLDAHGQTVATHNALLLQACGWMLQLTREQAPNAQTAR